MRTATIQAVSELLQNYKNNGGGSEFDDLSNYNKTTNDK